jgi:hypothetical protein
MPSYCTRTIQYAYIKPPPPSQGVAVVAKNLYSVRILYITNTRTCCNLLPLSHFHCPTSIVRSDGPHDRPSLKGGPAGVSSERLQPAVLVHIERRSTTTTAGLTHSFLHAIARSSFVTGSKQLRTGRKEATARLPFNWKRKQDSGFEGISTPTQTQCLIS